MASVNMTQQLQSEVIDNYRKQVQSAYEIQHDITSTVETIVSTLQDQAGPEFFMMKDLSEQFGTLADAMTKRYEAEINSKSTSAQHSWDSLDKYASAYLSQASRYHYDQEITKQSDYEPMRKVEHIVLVVNPERDINTNLDMICDWHGPYKERWNDKQVEASDNYLENDLVFKHKFVEPVYLPFTTEGGPNWHQAEEEYSPYANVGVLVTCPKMCEDLLSIPETEAKINIAIDKFEKFLLQFTTLKRFLDNYPEGKALVPDWAMERMAAKAKKRTANPNVVQELEVPEDLREEMNQVILENKLLGDS